MVSQIMNNIKADVIVLYKSSLIKISLLICFLNIASILFTSSKIVSQASTAGYYANQMLITLTQFSVFLMIIIGSFLGARDFEWQTNSLRLVNSSRKIVDISRIFTIFLLSAVLFFVHFVIGFLFDLLSGMTEVFFLHMCLKFFSVILVVMLWGCLSYIFAFATRSFSVASSVGIGYFLLESFVGRFLPEGILRVLPVWNQKNFLKSLFPINEGAVAIVQQQSEAYYVSLYVIVLYIIASILLLVILEKKKK